MKTRRALIELRLPSGFGKASQSDTHSQITSIQLHLLLQLGEQLVVEGFQLGRKHDKQLNNALLILNVDH